MNLNKNFLTEVIKYLISKGVTVHDVLDAFHAQFEYHEQALKRPDITWINMKQPSVEESSTPCTAIDSNRDLCQKVFDTSKEKQNEVRKPITDIDLLLCGREIEKQGFNVEPEPEPKENPAPLNVSLSPNTRDYPTSITPHGKGVSKARKMLFEVVEGKTVLEHLKANNIDYKLFDTRIRKNWSMEKACTTPLTKVVKPYTRAKKSEEPTAVIIPDTDVKCLEPENITGTKVTTAIIDDVIPTKNTAENVTIAPQAETDTDTRVNDTNANSDAKNSESERIEQLADKTVRDIVTGKNREKKKAEPKRDYTASDLCLKLGLTTHELREKIEMGEIPQPDCGNKWSAKLLKDKDIILFF